MSQHLATMQSPAIPKGECGCVTATKHIGLDSFRVRNCELGANRRPSMNRQSSCWNLDFEQGCDRQPSGDCAPEHWLVSSCDRDRRQTFVDGMDFGVGQVSKAIDLTQNCGQTRRNSFPHQRLAPSPLTLTADFDPAANTQADDFRGLVQVSIRTSPFNALFRPFSNRLGSYDAWRRKGGKNLLDRRFDDSWLATAGSQFCLRTHSLIRVSNEKRNADECPPAGGKSDRHR